MLSVMYLGETKIENSFLVLIYAQHRPQALLLVLVGLYDAHDVIRVSTPDIILLRHW